jgi:hypothetical protein
MQVLILVIRPSCGKKLPLLAATSSVRPRGKKVSEGSRNEVEGSLFFPLVLFKNPFSKIHPA